ncbi:uncharacterized protein LOC118646898 isoform X4 [Monomorium pharaonis]|uniref:uncharacterized protein LOC118646898 isoform X4 n=1 Tax=Monomorium pharaonis TaxID=307658 RepID=UPI001746EA8C|nr:uncharacterized protein LOC118646898 isoform X4 [Monomorium pharaonis]XP_036146703.1 uncharacterized protein LOC118646898 isoform X4 [Monomorium pharaonis]
MAARVRRATAVKCGYCGWLMFGSCAGIIGHDCFKSYDEDIHFIVVDEKGRATMRVKEVEENIAPPSESNNESTPYSTDIMDEMLIDAVEKRPGLWNQKLPVKRRSPCVRGELWDEVFNNLGFKDVAWMKSRWTYLRDCYSKARKKMKGYVRSGSCAEAGHPQKSTFRFYSRMQFLDDAAQETSTTSSLPRNICRDEDSTMNLNDSESQEHNVSSPRNCSTPDTPERPENSANCRPREKKRKQDDSDTQALHNNILQQLLGENAPKKDAVDSFLEQVGDILRRLSYLRRRQLQVELLQLVHRAEDKQLAEAELHRR